MKKFFKTIVVILTLVISIWFSYDFLFPLHEKPTLNKGHKWRVAYYEGGPYIDYQIVFSEMIKELMKQGWIEKAEVPKVNEDDFYPFWYWLSTTAKSDYLMFPLDAFYSSKWDPQQRDQNILDLIYTRLIHLNDIDIIVGLGTQAAKDLMIKDNKVPTMIVTASDLIKAKLLKDENDHTYKNVHATVTLYRYEKQIDIFYKALNFKKMGIFYENTVNGISYSGIDVVLKKSKELGFSVEVCFTKDETIDSQTERENSVLHCVDELFAKGVDALYIVTQSGVNQKTLPIISKSLIDHKIVSFSQQGINEVKLGILMSSAGNLKLAGKYESMIFSKILSGVPIESISQVFNDPIFIVINLSTMRKLGIKFSPKIRGATEVFFYE